MPSDKATLERILAAEADANIRFADVQRLLVRLGFAQRVQGDHFIYTREGVEEIINIQARGAQAKPDQVRQVRGLIVKYALVLEDEE
jgi:hypothetical protein